MSRRILPTATARRSATVLWRAIAERRRLLTLTVVLNVAASTAGVLAPLLLGRVVDAVTVGGPDARAAVLGLTGGLVAAALAAGVLLGFARRFTEQLGVTVAAALREDVMEHALQLDPHVLEAAGSGDVTSRVTEDVEQINASVALMARLVMALVTVAVTAVGLLSLDWRLALAFAAVFPVHWVGIRFVLPVLTPRFAAERRSAAVRTQEVLTTLEGAPTIRAYGMAPRRLRVVEAASVDTNAKRLTALRASLTYDNLMNYAEAVGFTAILTTGFFLVRADALTVGAVTAAALLFHRLFGPLGTLFMSFANVLRAAAALTRLVGVAEPAAARAVGPAVRAAARRHRRRREPSLPRRADGAARRLRGDTRRRQPRRRRGERRGQDDARRADRRRLPGRDGTHPAGRRRRRFARPERRAAPSGGGDTGGAHLRWHTGRRSAPG